MCTLYTFYVLSNESISKRVAREKCDVLKACTGKESFGARPDSIDPNLATGSFRKGVLNFYISPVHSPAIPVTVPGDENED